MSRKIRKQALNLKNLIMLERGVFSGYYKLSETHGLKLLQCPGYTSIKKLRRSRLWRFATRESTLLKKAQQRVDFTPKFFETVPVKCDYLYFPGIIMQHIEGKLVSDYYKGKAIRETVMDELKDKLEKAGIYHDDLHCGNAIVCSKSNKHYVIDFTPDFIEIEYE